jgi:uncharacterized membrane protein
MEWIYFLSLWIGGTIIDVLWFTILFKIKGMDVVPYFKIDTYSRPIFSLVVTIYLFAQYGLSAPLILSLLIMIYFVISGIDDVKFDRKLKKILEYKNDTF